MKSIASRLVPLAAICALVSLSGSAFADALPEDACETNAAVGSACNNAGDHFDEPGVCANETCESSHPDPDGGTDSGFVTTTYPCVLCEVDGGSPSNDGGSSGDGGAITTRPDGGSDGSSSSSSSSSCSFSPGDRDGAAGFGMLALGMIGLALSRKKRH